jgi:thiamine-monophosphate kinase
MNPFTDNPASSLSALGEERLIAAIRGWLGKACPKAPFGIGDDCAVLPPGSSAQLLTVDPVIYGEHFDDKVPAIWAGEKLFKRNLSDIAAMGGRPRAAVVSLALDSRVKLSWLRAFYQGLAKVSLRYGVPLVGGDIAHHKGGIIATLTLVGEQTPGGRVLTRQGAEKGDWIYITGCLGRSLPSRHHYRFEPRLGEGSWLSRRIEIKSMMDVSDGLAKDLRALTPRGCVPAIEPVAIPARQKASLREMLCDGEDYELVFSVDADAPLDCFERDFKEAFPKTKLSLLGRFVSTGHLPASAVPLSDYHGFEHLR